ncbi:MAG: hypothetical protein Ct9H300mP18_06100 [Candidatus Neomarinimicrobiota bacterium]|nr:MAG: hypothetical protein Ct9H300mP18_06100 [Candidatus Neomarinimicrobiota bacterium]
MVTNFKKSFRLILPLIILASIGTLYAAPDENSKEISIFLIAPGLLGGMGMFLYGMEMMSDGMKMTAGNSMGVFFRKTNFKKIFLSVFVGAFVTRVIQSSSATTVMLVSFVNSGLLNFTQA